MVYNLIATLNFAPELKPPTLLIRNAALGILSIMVGLTYAQQAPKVDSLRTLVETSQGSVRIDAINALAYEIVFSNPAESEKLAHQALKESETIDYERGTMDGYRVLGISFDIRSDYVSAINAYKKGLPIAESTKDPSLIVPMLNVLGVAYYHLSQYHQALQYFLEALKLADKLDQPRFQTNLFTNIGLVYHDQNELDKALDYYERAMVYGERTNDKRLMGRVANNIGLILNQKKLYENAKLYYEKSLQYKQEVGDGIGISTTQQNLGVVYKNLGDLEKASELLRESEAYKKQAGDILGLVQVYTGEIDVLLLRNKFAQAEDLLKVNADLIEKIDSKEPLINHYDGYKRLYFLMGRCDESEKWQIKKDSIKELLFNEQKSNQLATLQSLYELDKKETEIQLLQNERDRQKLQRNISIILMAGGTLVVFILGILFYQRQKQQRIYIKAQQRLHESEIQNSQLREAELKRDLEYKNRELTSYTINFIQKGQLLEDLRENITQIMSSSESEVASKLNPLKKVVESNYQIDKEWNDFKLRFEEVYTGFFEQLKADCPELSTGDLRLCALLRLDMNIKESSKILGISTNSVKTSRSRLRKKLNLEKDESLNDFIMKFGGVSSPAVRSIAKFSRLTGVDL